MAHVAERADTLSPVFDAFRRDPAFGTGGLGPARSTAFERFLRQGFPTTRQEEWSHTNVAPIAAIAFDRAPVADASVADVEPFLFAADIPHRVVLVNGRWSKALSSTSALPAGVTVKNLRDVPEQAGVETAGATPFADLNAALFEDGVYIEIAPKTVVAEPLHLVSITVTGASPALVSPRFVISVGERAQVFLVESYAGLGTQVSWTNTVTRVDVSPDAMVDHVKFQREQPTTFHLATMMIRVDRAATFRSHAVTLGARIARNDLISTLAGEGAECTLDGLYVAGGDSLVDTHTTIDHAMPHCPSHELYKGILADKARAVFNGKIIVRQDAQKTNAKQTNKALLLSDEAQVNTKPQLEIFADDVKCTHGAAIGQLDEDALFYMQARGIGAADARNLMIHAFAAEVLDGVREDAVREQAMRLLEEKLSLWKV